MKNIEGNKFFKNAKKRASNILKNKGKLKHLFNVSSEKLSELKVENINNTTVVSQIKVLIRLVKAYVKGHYRDVDLQTILMIVAGLVYFVTPLDLIPDFIPITGLVDDFAVILWVYSKVQQEIYKFIEWEQQEQQIENG
ncbi:MAG TPA: YkvA family protein [Fulvivirga sp.]|nr:YkvA family protein [Fulvivirga sp.]